MKLKSIVKDHFFSGVLILAPLLVIMFVFHWIFGGLVAWIDEGPVNWVLQDPHHFLRPVLRYAFLLLSLGIGFAVISIVGFLSKFYLGKKVVEFLGEIIEKVPLFGTIYTSLVQLLRTLSNKGGKQFSRVVYVEYPRKDVWAVGFVTGPSKLKGLPKGLLNVFVPCTPNPTSGFHLLVSEKEVIESDLKVDEAFRLILSLGMVHD